MQQRWVSKLLDYDFIFDYNQDKDNKVVDALSRRFEEKKAIVMTLTMVSVPNLELLDELRQLYLSNPNLQCLLQKGKEEKLDPKYLCRDGLLYYKHKLYIANDKSFKTKLLKFSYSNPKWDIQAMIKPFIG